MKTIAIVRAGALGDLILLRGTVTALRRAGFHVTLLAPPRAGSVLLGDGPDDAQRLLDWEGRDVARLLTPSSDPSALRASLGTYDVAFCYSRSRELAHGLEALGARVVVQDPEPAEGHAAPWLARPLAEIGVVPVEPRTILAREDDVLATRSWRDRLPARFLAIHPGSGSARKNWPAERFAALAAHVAAGEPWLLSLGPADDLAAAELQDAPGAVVVRDLPPRRLGALLAAAGLYVGNDSGVSHLAAAHGAPALVLFGPTDPAVWSPIGPAVRTLRATDGDLTRLGVDEVREASACVSAYVSGARTSTDVNSQRLRTATARPSSWPGTKR